MKILLWVNAWLGGSQMTIEESMHVHTSMTDLGGYFGG